MEAGVVWIVERKKEKEKKRKKEKVKMDEDLKILMIHFKERMNEWFGLIWFGFIENQPF